MSILFSLGIVLWLSSCAQMTLSHVTHLRNGMTSEQTRTVIGIPPQYFFFVELTEPWSEIEVHSHILHSSDYYSDFFLAFKDNRLIYWGYPHEFARAQDPYINKIGEKAVNRLQQVKSEQEKTQSK
jgi:hypothetical protein